MIVRMQSQSQKDYVDIVGSQSLNYTRLRLSIFQNFYANDWYVNLSKQQITRVGTRYLLIHLLCCLGQETVK